MAKNTVNDRIRSRVEAFAEELSALIRDSAMETVRDALGGGGAAPRGRGGRGGRAAAASAPPVRGGGRREKGQKRDPGEIERLTGRLLDYVKGNAGQRIEQIAAGMGTVTKELNLPVKKLIAQKALKTKGQKRATQYFAR
ncbi:MAG TPA: DNA-binding protein [Polyangiaceae bacterium]|nr:DNA-binding protein [Polyangiaceae bacterium]